MPFNLASFSNWIAIRSKDLSILPLVSPASTIIAFVMGCILGSVIHLLRMKLTNEDHVLAMGPYLAAGILLAALWGDSLLQMYMRLW